MVSDSLDMNWACGLLLNMQGWCLPHCNSDRITGVIDSKIHFEPLLVSFSIVQHRGVAAQLVESQRGKVEGEKGFRLNSVLS